MKKLNKRTDIMDNSVEAYACACSAECNCKNMCSCDCKLYPAQEGSINSNNSMGIQGFNYTNMNNAKKTGVNG